MLQAGSGPLDREAAFGPKHRDHICSTIFPSTNARCEQVPLYRCTCTNLHTKTDSIFLDRIAIHFVTTRHLDYDTGINDLGYGRTSVGLGTKVGYAPAIFRIAVNDPPISMSERLIQERVGEVVRTLSCSADVAALNDALALPYSLASSSKSRALAGSAAKPRRGSVGHRCAQGDRPETSGLAWLECIAPYHSDPSANAA